MKDAATISTSLEAPNFKSETSFSVRAGKFIATLGTFIPLLFPITPEFLTIVFITLSSTSTTSKATNPSFIKIISLGSISSFKLLYVTEHLVASPKISSPQYIENSVPCTSSNVSFSNL